MDFWSLLSIIWATVHDFVYLGVYFLLTHFHILKRHKTAEDRIAECEAKLGIKT